VNVRDLSGNVVAITGASAGIGAASARALVAEGASVVLGARRVERLEALAEELGENVVYVEMDVREPGDSAKLVEKAYSSFGRLDALVANAGIGAYGGIMDLSDEQLAVMMDTNVAGTVWPIRAAVPRFLEAGEGDIVIVASVAGLRGAGDEAVYAATKFAQVGLAGALDRELRQKGIRVSTLCPGGTATEFAMGAGRTPDMPGLARHDETRGHCRRRRDRSQAAEEHAHSRLVDEEHQRRGLGQHNGCGGSHPCLVLTPGLLSHFRFRKGLQLGRDRPPCSLARSWRTSWVGKRTPSLLF
jgi:NADP-dependent 3-hydroxy acid dehydrogenase YdfG